MANNSLHMIDSRLIEGKEDKNHAIVGSNAMCVSLFPGGVVIGIYADSVCVKEKRRAFVVCAGIGNPSFLSALMRVFQKMESFIDTGYGAPSRYMTGSTISMILAGCIKARHENELGAAGVEFLVVDILRPHSKSQSKRPIPKCWIIAANGDCFPFHGGVAGLRAIPSKQPSERVIEAVEDAQLRSANLPENIEEEFVAYKLGESKRLRLFASLRERIDDMLNNSARENASLEDAISSITDALKKLVKEEDIFWGARNTAEIRSYASGKRGAQEGAMKVSKKELMSLK